MLLLFKPIKANAKNLDYLDYVTQDNYVDGYNNLKIQIPISDFTQPVWDLRYYEDGNYLDTQYGDAFIWDEPGERSLDLTLNAFEGTRDAGQDYLLIRDIPNDSTLTLFYRIVDVYEYSYITMSVQWSIMYFDINYNYLGLQQTNREYGDIEANALDIEIQKPDGAVWMQCVINWAPLRGFDTTDFHLVAEFFEFDISIDAMLRDQQLTGQTNKLLEKVNDSLNTSVPGAQDSINNSNDAQDRLDAAGDALANVPKPPLNSVNSSISGYVSTESSQQTNSFLGALWESELFMTMIILLLTIGTCSYVLFGKR